MTDWRIIEGDCRDVLRSLAAGSAHTCVTSPPYFGLRDYGTDGQIGLEPTPDEFVAALVGVFREVRRVLRDDGTVWLNLGDSYAASGTTMWPNTSNGYGNGYGKHGAWHGGESIRPGRSESSKPKDLLGIPWMVAFALRADGWYLRSDIIWAKPNPMPESVTDRPTKAHEYVFLLSKGPRYFYDADAIREDATYGPSENFRGSRYTGGRSFDNSDDSPHTGGGRVSLDGSAGRNKRSVWTVATQPYAGAHFATFPPKLIEPCILAGAPERACGECGAPWVRVEGERTLDLSRPQARRARELADGAGLTVEHIAAIRSCGVADTGKAQVTQGGYGKNDAAVQALADQAKAALGGYYREFLLARPGRGELAPSCSHDDGSAQGRVLDPFAGAGTTGMVALRHNRSFIGIELSPEYAQMARDRIADHLDPLGRHMQRIGQGDLFGDAA